jgi:crotonobetainyl-CoA:carnitine CoA-transferase CaiB-like acyl-CoA transferase
MLLPFRVLDLTDHRGSFAGMLFAAMGAEVIAIEPPGGSTSRYYRPFIGDQRGVERSIYHWSYNRGKKSVVLDIKESAGRLKFLDLLRGADVLLDSFDPGYLDSIGLHHGSLADANSSLVHTSITAFGSTGPKANWAATDLTLMAASGAMILTGDPDRAPLRVSLPPQAWLHASAEAAGATLLALYERARSGIGQHVDVSAQQAAMMVAQSQALAAANNACASTRAGGGAKVGGINLRFGYPAADGQVVIAVMFGSMVGPYMHRLFEWIYEEGLCNEATRDFDWIDYARLVLTGQRPKSEYDHIVNTISNFTCRKTKAELFDGAVKRRLLIAPVANARDVLNMAHMTERRVWETIEAPEGNIRLPGRFAIFSRSPLPKLGPPPRLGQHTEEVLECRARVREPGDGSGRPNENLPALHGLKVLDFAWVMAGPATTRVLADYGATVVRVESAERPDLVRLLAPRIEDNPSSLEHSVVQQNLNAGKLGLVLNLNTPQAREVVIDLVRWADVVFDSFAPGAMKSWGFDYENLSKVNPQILQVSSSLMGQWGPLASFAGFGNLAAAVSGFYEVTGWPDRDSVGPFGAYTDTLGPRFALLAILGGLEHRRRTGEGQYIDLSQAESAMHFFTQAILELQVNGTTVTRLGNADRYCAPHGVYPSAGEDRWIAISCETDQQWHSLCAEMRRLDLSENAAFTSAEGRVARFKELDEIVANWTAGRDVLELEAQLQARGIPAHHVESSADVVADPQLAFRGHLVELPHPIHGRVVVEGSRFQLSRTPAIITKSGPTLGQHSQQVLKEILGYDAAKIAELFSCGAVG